MSNTDIAYISYILIHVAIYSLKNLHKKSYLEPSYIDKIYSILYYNNYNCVCLINDSIY